MSVPTRRAVFLDRDGTIIEDRRYLADAEGVTLLPGAARGLRRLAEAGYLLVVTTNQSGIARGMFGEAEFRAVQKRMESLLHAHGVTLDGVYHCPHHPDHTGPCDCRKPAPGMALRAARELDIRLTDSVFVGDRPRDVEAAPSLGARGILLGPADPGAPFATVPDLDALADLLVGTAPATPE